MSGAQTPLYRVPSWCAEIQIYRSYFDLHSLIYNAYSFVNELA